MKSRLFLFVFLLFQLATPAFSATIFYVYDELDRLREVKFENGQKLTYEYDQIGNLISKTPATIGSTPDLVVSSITAPANASPGQQISIPVTVGNLGQDVAGGFYVNIYLSSDSNITTSDTYLGQQYVSSLPAYGSKTISITATLPVVNSGNYYIGAIADATNMVMEANKTNNIKSSLQTSILTCPSGFTYNSSRIRCEKNVECPSGATYNASTYKCVSTPTCSSGTYSTSTDNCITSGSYAATLSGGALYNVPIYNGLRWYSVGDGDYSVCDTNVLSGVNTSCGIKGYLSPTSFAGAVPIYNGLRWYSVGDGDYSVCDTNALSGVNTSCGIKGYLAPSSGNYGGSYTCPSGGTISGTTCNTSSYTTATCPVGSLLDGASDKCTATPICSGGTLDSAANVCWANQI